MNVNSDAISSSHFFLVDYSMHLCHMYTLGNKLGNTQFSANYFHVGVNNKKNISLTQNFIISLWNLEQYKVKCKGNNVNYYI